MFSGALVLWHLGREATPRAAADRIRYVLDAGVAAQRMR